MRRGSLIGPILLILIGGLFLAHNLKPELPLLELVARYWPLLLIGWGVIRLLEILYWAVRSRPLPFSGVSGGEWVLVIFICLFGSGIYVANKYRDRWPQARITMHGIEMFGETYDFPLQARQAAGKSPRVVIENLRGNTRIVGADTEEVKVEGRMTVRAWQQSDADKVHKQCPLEISVQNSQIIIQTNQERVTGPERVAADLEITVPRGASVQGRGRDGDFDITAITGDVEIESADAGVRLQDIGGSARADLKRSDIVRATGLKGTFELKGRGRDIELENVDGDVTINGSYSGELLFRNLAKPLHFESSQTQFLVEKVPGQVRMALGDLTANNVTGPIQLKTRTRDVRIADFTGRVEISLDRGDVELRPVKLPVSAMDVRTRSGDCAKVGKKPRIRQDAGLVEDPTAVKATGTAASGLSASSKSIGPPGWSSPASGETSERSRVRHRNFQALRQ
jgi:DUF4097 and DUF4098 domain-containing protein YvlB